MPRPSKIEVSAINLRIPSANTRNYTSLIASILELKQGVRVHGNSYVAITDFHEPSGMGVLSKYDEIDIDGDWFDVDDFNVAGDAAFEGVHIPENLRPNYSAFYFKLDQDAHVIAFENYSESKSLSSRSVERYFRTILSDDSILDAFGNVQADIVKSYAAVDEIFSLPDLLELKVVIRRPNSDDLSGDLASEIEDRLAEENADELEESIRTKDGQTLTPNERTKSLSYVAAENGSVIAKSIVNGVKTETNTDEKPLKEIVTYYKEEKNARDLFIELAKKIIEAIKGFRESIRQGS